MWSLRENPLPGTGRIPVVHHQVRIFYPDGRLRLGVDSESASLYTVNEPIATRNSVRDGWKQGPPKHADVLTYSTSMVRRGRSSYAAGSLGNASSTLRKPIRGLLDSEAL